MRRAIEVDRVRIFDHQNVASRNVQRVVGRVPIGQRAELGRQIIGEDARARCRLDKRHDLGAVGALVAHDHVRQRAVARKVRVGNGQRQWRADVVASDRRRARLPARDGAGGGNDWRRTGRTCVVVVVDPEHVVPVRAEQAECTAGLALVNGRDRTIEHAGASRTLGQRNGFRFARVDVGDGSHDASEARAVSVRDGEGDGLGHARRTDRNEGGRAVLDGVRVADRLVSQSVRAQGVEVGDAQDVERLHVKRAVVVRPSRSVGGRRQGRDELVARADPADGNLLALVGARIDDGDSERVGGHVRIRHGQGRGGARDVGVDGDGAVRAADHIRIGEGLGGARAVGRVVVGKAQRIARLNGKLGRRRCARRRRQVEQERTRLGRGGAERDRDRVARARVGHNARSGGLSVEILVRQEQGHIIANARSVDLHETVECAGRRAIRGRDDRDRRRRSRTPIDERVDIDLVAEAAAREIAPRVVARRSARKRTVREVDRGVRRAPAGGRAVQNRFVVIVDIGRHFAAVADLPDRKAVVLHRARRAARRLDVATDEVELAEAHGKLRGVVSIRHTVAQHVGAVPSCRVGADNRVAVEEYVALTTVNAIWAGAARPARIDGDSEGRVGRIRFERERARVLHADGEARREGDVLPRIIQKAEVRDGWRALRWRLRDGRWVEVEVVERRDVVARLRNREGRGGVDANAVGDDLVDETGEKVEVELPNVVGVRDATRRQHVVVGVRCGRGRERVRVVIPALGGNAAHDARRTGRIGVDRRARRHCHVEAIEPETGRVDDADLVLTGLGGHVLFGRARAVERRVHRVVARYGAGLRRWRENLDAIGIDDLEGDRVRVDPATGGKVDHLARIQNVDGDRGGPVLHRSRALKTGQALKQADLIDPFGRCHVWTKERDREKKARDILRPVVRVAHGRSPCPIGSQPPTTLVRGTWLTTPCTHGDRSSMVNARCPSRTTQMQMKAGITVRGVIYRSLPGTQRTSASPPWFTVRDATKRKSLARLA